MENALKIPIKECNTQMDLFDCGLVGRLLRDGLEQVAAEVVQPNLEPEETFFLKLVKNRMYNAQRPSRCNTDTCRNASLWLNL